MSKLTSRLIPLILLVLAACNTTPPIIEPAPPEPGTPPTLNVALTGPVVGPDRYHKRATLTLSATSSARIEMLEYSLNKAPFARYTAPIELTEVGDYALVARARDSEQKSAEKQATFSIVATTLTVRLDGTTNEVGAYLGSVTVFLSAKIDDTLLGDIRYRFGDDDDQDYSAPIAINTPGRYSLTAKQKDDSDTLTKTFEVIAVPTSPGDPGDPPGDPGDPPPASGTLTLRNQIISRDANGAPILGFYEDRLVMHRIQDTSGWLGDHKQNGYDTLKLHDRVTLTLGNSASDPLTITALTLSDPARFALDNTALPITLGSGESYDLVVSYTETVAKTNPNPKLSQKIVREGTLSIETSGGNRKVEVVGLFMEKPEDYYEVTVQQIADAFFGKNVINIGEPLVSNDKEPKGDEVRSDTWRRLNSSAPVIVRQIVALHGCCKSTEIFSIPNSGSFRHAAAYSQTIFPLKDGSDAPAELVTTPASSTFEIHSAGYSSKPNKGLYAIRFWPVKDRSGVPLVGSYLMVQDYIGSGCDPTGQNNCDYNDNMYLVTNVVPANSTTPPPASNATHRLNVAGSSYTDTSGNSWSSDSGFFTPTNAPIEPAGGGDSSLAIANTSDDTLYQTYRALLPGTSVGNRVLSYALPVSNGSYTVALHFAEIYWGVPGKGQGGVGSRVFDVTLEGNAVLTNFDIFKEAGGAQTAISKDFSVQVSDGVLNINFIAQKDYGAISAIEVKPVP